MTIPRQVVPERDYMTTRRCSERRFFLRPDAETNNAFIYCLALAAQRAKVEVTFTESMSNHHHTGIHDPHGNFPVFTEHFHGLLARCQNCYLGHFENFWSSEPTSVVELAEPEDVLEKMVYGNARCAAGDGWDSAPPHRTATIPPITNLIGPFFATAALLLLVRQADMAGQDTQGDP